MQAKGCSKNGTKQASRLTLSNTPKPKPKTKQTDDYDDDDDESEDRSLPLAGRMHIVRPGQRNWIGQGTRDSGHGTRGTEYGIRDMGYAIWDMGYSHVAAAMPNQRTRRRDASAGQI